MKTFFESCVSWPQRDVNAEGGLCDMIDGGREITRRTFVRHVNPAQLAAIEAALGYDSRLKMKNDPYVTYHKGKLHGQWVVWFRHSAIEYVFR